MMRPAVRKWTPTTLGQEVDLLTGFPFKSQQYTDAAEGIPLLRGDNVAQGRLRWNGVKRWPTDLLEGLGQYALRDGDVILAMDRPWIEAGLKFAAISEHDLPCLLVQRVACLRGRETLNTRYLRYLIGSPGFTNHILAVQTGTAVPHISGGQIESFAFLRPSLSEQQAIAEILGSLDDRIELNRRTNRTLEQMAAAIFKAWFVDFEPVKAKAAGATSFPTMLQEVFDALPTKFTNSPLGPIPKRWQVVGVGDVAACFDSKRIPLSRREREKRPGRYPYYGAASIMDYLNDYLFDGVYVLMGEDGSVITGDGNPVIQYAWGQFWVNNHAHVLLGKNGVSTEHLMLSLKQSNLAPFVTGAVQLKLNQRNMNQIPFTLATSDVLSAFAEIVDPLYAKHRASVEESGTLAEIRDTLLPKLLSGEIRVGAAEGIVEEVA